METVNLNSFAMSDDRWGGRLICEYDFSGKSIAGEWLHEADASYSNFEGSSLRWVKATRCDFRGASLRGADLRDADLSEADFRGADLTNADLTGADLTDANLQGARVVGAKLPRSADLAAILGIELVD